MSRANGPCPLTTISAGTLTMAAKKCTKCGETKPLSGFSSNGPGLTKSRCKSCRSADESARFASLPADRRKEEIARIYQWQLVNKDKWKGYSTKWRLANTESVNLRTQMRRRRYRQATPVWADKAAIRSLYQLAVHMTKETGIQHEVDHVIPLQNGLVCGLHCEANLRVIPITVNRKKSNKV